MPWSRRRIAPFLLAVAAVLPGTATRTADAGDPAPAEPARCTCRSGNACYHWLNAPVTPPADPCSCPNCRVDRGSCAKTHPADWNSSCARSERLECFLRRHSVSWKLACSEELDRCECPGGESASCPACGGGGKPPNEARLLAVRRQVQVERRLAGRDASFVVVTSPHFYLVSDIPSLRVLTQNGSRRELGMHELAHLYIQRAELAYRDFARVLGDEHKTNRPVAIFLNRRRADSERLQTEYFGRPNAGLVYGLRGSNPPISGGFAEAGLASNLDQQPNDEALHQRVRTSVGHVLVSLWHRPEATPAYLPMWVFLGAGHWLGRLPVPFEEHAQFVGGEGNSPRDEGNDWLKRLGRIVAKGDLPHADTFFGFTSLSQTDLTTHMRAWGWFSLFLGEDRERFAALLRLIREGKNQRDAVQQAFGCTLDELEIRWRDRVTGKRRSLAEEKGGADATSPAGGLADLAGEPDERTIADRIKARPPIDDPAEAAALVALLSRDSDVVTERVVLALAKARAGEVREYLRGEALETSRGRVRAGVVRILGLAKDEGAAEPVAALLSDPDADVRAQAAIAMGRLRHGPAVPALRSLVADREDDVAIAAMDALAAFGESAEDEWMRVAPRLDDPRRPVRTAAAECLGALGSMESVEALIARMQMEAGRVRADIRLALQRISRDDLGSEPAAWRKWWDKEKARTPGKTPGRPAEKPPEAAGASRYAAEKPAFYGVEIFSKRLAFVLDVSSSMSDHIVVDASWLANAGRKYRADATKYELAVSEIASTLRSVDPRLEFGIVAFRTDVRTWRERLVAASPGSIEQALEFLGSQHPPPLSHAGDPARQKTNLADALRLMLGIRPGTSGRATDEAADEAYVMTDGQPTAGDLADADVLLSWFRERNRSARVRLHVVTFETVDTDLTFLRALAAAGGGTFVAIPTAKR